MKKRVDSFDGSKESGRRRLKAPRDRKESKFTFELLC